MNYALYDSAGNKLIEVAARDQEDALARHSKAAMAVRIHSQHECWYCQDSGIVAANVGGEQLETTCSHCVERQRINHLEVEVSELRLIIDLLVDRLRQTMLSDDLDNLPLPRLSRTTDEIPF